MVTYDIAPNAVKSNKATFSFKGLSTDVKPTGEVDGIDIRNGSSFLEIDTQEIKFYNEEGEIWV